MFGVSRKKAKPKRQVRSATLDDDDNDHDENDAHHRAQQLIQQRHNKKNKIKCVKSKNSAASMLSFDPDEEMNDNDELPINKKKKRRKGKHKHAGGGLGYGGIHEPSDGSASEGEDEIMGDDDDEGEHARVGSFYDKSALEKLRREQKRSTFAPKEDVSVSVPADTELNEGGLPVVKEDNVENAEELFIPLPARKRRDDNSSNILDEVVLTGDEAMAFAQREEDANDDTEFDHGLQSPPTPPPTASSSGGIATDNTRRRKIINTDVNFDMMDTDEPSNDDDEGNRQWEDTMVRRAGVLPPKAASSDDEGNRSTVRRQQSTNQTNLVQIRASLQPIISTLENVSLDLESSISRHKATIHSSRDELTQNQSTLEKHGKALEYYQALREDLATWMGALRELNGMVNEVEEARRLLEAEMTIRRMERFLEWGNDCMEVLEKQGLLANTAMKAGIHPKTSSGYGTEHVDEFGRDLSSLSSIARIKRWNQRKKRSLNRLQDQSDEERKSSLEQGIACSNVDNFDSVEIGEWKQRRDVLAQALAIIPELVKENYLSISKLCTIFLDWKRMYPEDYASCYAEMTLVQMIEVLTRLEMCERWDVLNLSVESSNNRCLGVSDFNWFRATIESNSQGGELCEVGSAASQSSAPIVFEVIEKQIVSRVLHSFSFDDGAKGDTKLGGIYDPFSVEQTKLLCAMIKSVFRCFSKYSDDNGKVVSEHTAEKLMDALMKLVGFVVEKLGVPVVDASKITLTRNEFATRDNPERLDNETSDAIAFATVIQVHELCNLVKNMLGQWYPIFKHELCQQQERIAALVRYVLEDLVSLRLLPVLHSLHSITSGGSENDERYMRMPKTFVEDIMDTIDSKASLDPAEWMLMLAPLRVTVKQLLG